MSNSPFTQVVCFACGDLGFTLDGTGVINQCWRQKSGIDHNLPNEAAKMIARAVQNLTTERVPIDQHVFGVAKTLSRYTSESPCKRDRLADIHFAHVRDPKRECALLIETLRKVWLLPVGGRKEPPFGYWLITDIDDFAEWVSRAKAAPITQLTTIHRVAKRNFPIFAEQMELEFYNDIVPHELNKLAA